MKIGNLKFTARDIINLPSLAAKLVKPANAALQFIASGFSEKTRGLLTAYPADNSVSRRAVGDIGGRPQRHDERAGHL